MTMTILIKPLMLTTAWLATSVTAQTPPPQPLPDAPAETLGIGTDRNERMTVPVQIDGKGPYAFVVDTGAERTVISRELAGTLKLGSGGSAQLHSMTGEGSVDMVIIPTLSVTADQVRGIRAPALAQAHLGAAGMLGIDSLKKNRVLLDFTKQTMTVSASGKRVVRSDPDEIIVTAKSRFGQLILADADVDGNAVSVIIDTGAQVSVGNMALRRKVFGRNPKRVLPQVELISVTGGRMMAEYARIEKIKIGGVTLTDMPVAFADAHPFKKFELSKKPALLLGMNALRAFDRVAVDFANRRVHFLLPDGAVRNDNTLMALADKQPGDS